MYAIRSYYDEEFQGLRADVYIPQSQIDPRLFDKMIGEQGDVFASLPRAPRARRRGSGRGTPHRNNFV